MLSGSVSAADSGQAHLDVCQGRLTPRGPWLTPCCPPRLGPFLKTSPVTDIPWLFCIIPQT